MSKRASNRADCSGSAKDANSLDPQLVPRLRQAVPDLDDGSRSRHVDPADIPVGRQIVQVLTPCLPHLLDQCLAKAGLRRLRSP